MAVKTVISVDLGADSGRVMAVHYNGQNLTIEELHRFPNSSVVVNDTLHWNFLKLWGDIRDGITKAKSLKPESIGLDTWGVDFALLDSKGNLIGNPVHYRDKRTDGIMEEVFQRVDKTKIFEKTGIQFMQINTLYQLYNLVATNSPQLQIAETFLTAPDLLNYWLTGVKSCEFTNATTTQMLDPNTKTWASEIIEDLEIPDHIFPEIVPPGTKLGEYENIPVIAPACHDTGSAVAAVPTSTPNFAYISSGTWSLVGLEVDSPIINSEALKANVTNEGGVYGTFRLLKNVMGLWIVQQCRKAWQESGKSYSYPELTQMAADAKPLQTFISPNDPTFLHPGDYPGLIREFCKQTNQPIPESEGAIIRCVLESLALAYRDVLEKLQSLSGKQVEVIHIVGGGIQNDLLCQMTANATGIPVKAGPVEATVIGNAIVQLITLGELKNIHEARQLVTTIDEIKQYEPTDIEMWDEAFKKYSNVLN